MARPRKVDPFPSVRLYLDNQPSEVRRAMEPLLKLFEQILVTHSQAINALIDGNVGFFTMEQLTAAPQNIKDGMVIYADGTTFNPGAGQGVYERRGGAWVKL